MLGAMGIDPRGMGRQVPHIWSGGGGTNINVPPEFLLDLCMCICTYDIVIQCYNCLLHLTPWGTGIRGLMRGMATLPKVNRSY